MFQTQLLTKLQTTWTKKRNEEQWATETNETELWVTTIAMAKDIQRQERNQTGLDVLNTTKNRVG